MSAEMTAGAVAVGPVRDGSEAGGNGGGAVAWLGRRDPASVPPAVLAEAEATAAAAARAAGVGFAELHSIAEMHEAAACLDRVWQPVNGTQLIPAALLKVLAHCGSYIVGVYRDGRMVGVCLGLLADFGLHSHVAGIDDALRGAGVGRAVKLHQRAWSLRRGIGVVTWTYDPLVSRNAYFNLAKLGAVPAEYLTDYYGEMGDALNAGIPSDRLLVRWELAGPHTAAVLAGAYAPATAGAVVALGVGPDGGPDVTGAAAAGLANRLLVAVPRDVEALRVADPALAARWRTASREVLAPLLAGGARITGFLRDGWYLIERPTGLDDESAREQENPA